METHPCREEKAGIHCSYSNTNKLGQSEAVQLRGSVGQWLSGLGNSHKKQMHQGSLLGALGLHGVRGAEKQSPLPSQDLT